MTEEKKVTPTKATTTKTTTSRKPTVKKTVEKEQVKLSNDSKIPVMNNTTGRYGYIGRSGYSFELEEYGDVADVPFGELQAMRSGSQKRHLEDAFIIILDDEAVAELNYTKLYKNILNADGIEELFSDPERLRETIPQMPSTMRETVVSIAKQKYKDRTLFDIRVIEAIEKSLNVQIID